VAAASRGAEIAMGARGDAVGDGDQEAGFQNSRDRLLWEAGEETPMSYWVLLPGRWWSVCGVGVSFTHAPAGVCGKGKKESGFFFPHYRLYPLSHF